MPALLTTASVLMCPHGGTVTASSGNTRVKAAQAFVLRQSDQFVVAGCSLSGATPPSPCVQVRWVAASRSKAAGDATLNESSTGLCVAASQAVQGTVLIGGVQPRVTGR